MINKTKIRAINKYDIRRRKIHKDSRMYLKDFIKISPILNEYIAHIMSEEKPKRIIDSNIYR